MVSVMRAIGDKNIFVLSVHLMLTSLLGSVFVTVMLLTYILAHGMHNMCAIGATVLPCYEEVHSLWGSVCDSGKGRRGLGGSKPDFKSGKGRASGCA